MVSPPILQLPTRIFEREEPVGVEALGAQPAVERLDERVVGWLARPAEIERDVVGVSPEIEVA